MRLDRRTFLGGTLAAGVALSQRGGARAAQDVCGEGLTKADLPTPALLVDLDAFEFNLKVVADQCRQTGCGFRPHAKTHKCPEIARRQVAAGALGICTATVPEAEAMVAAGIPGVLLTSPIVEPRKIARMLHLARQGRGVMLSLGHPRQAELLSAAAAAQSLVADVLLDLDVGDRRTGITPGPAALELAKLVARSAGLRLRGLQAYAGFASHAKGFEQRTKVSTDAMNKALETRDLLAKAGLETDILSGGSTGTYNIDSGIKGITELQVGSYVFMDVGYRSIGGKDGATVYGDFKPSLTVLTTVVSTTHQDMVTIDAGIKAFSTDVSDRPQAKSWEGLTYGRFGDEFGSLKASEGASLPRLGDRLEFIVPHCDPTVNLYDRIYAIRGEKVEEVWPIAARRG